METFGEVENKGIIPEAASSADSGIPLDPDAPNASTPHASTHTTKRRGVPGPEAALSSALQDGGAEAISGSGAVPFSGELIMPWRALRSAYDPRPIAITIPAFDLYTLPSFDLEFASRQWPHPVFA